MGEQRRKKAFQAASVTPFDTKSKWRVFTVLAFWIFVGITLAVMLFTGKLNLILASITFGLMVLGVWLKLRFQLLQRRVRGRTSGSDLI